ncbi:PR domain zinc finger protein 1 [Amphibalanus amphitrite]|uniref:PR domain zinc finger protein 1 n=1 Tax=Amphibalanus amphitrite TaxID=1232801 RepID=A0A6A4W193_AMPAM|nr:PR domain zinc finger protein 1 [Amphibalanus amphitrite]KAF0304952.1 PR domain zinc finger protein 1 [Amphibalanus amphitrite]
MSLSQIVALLRKCVAMPTSETEDACWNLEELSESEFDARATFLVRDSPVAEGTEQRAHASLPKNVTIKEGVSGVRAKIGLPQGTRFGPLVGEPLRRHQVSPTAIKKYFWRVYTSSDDYYFLDARDTSKSNWMRYVNPAFSPNSQNLVAVQHEQNIYFYTIRDIEPGEELLVWYCREFAHRLNYPVSGSLMLDQIQQRAKAAPAAGEEVKQETTGAETAGHAARQQTSPVRSDEGYLSHEYQPDSPHHEPSSDDDCDNNYVLDFSKSGKRPRDEDDSRNEFRKVKIKMSKAYHIKSQNEAERRRQDSTSVESHDESAPAHHSPAVYSPPMTSTPASPRSAEPRPSSPRSPPTYHVMSAPLPPQQSPPLPPPPQQQQQQHVHVSGGSEGVPDQSWVSEAYRARPYGRAPRSPEADSQYHQVTDSTQVGSGSGSGHPAGREFQERLRRYGVDPVGARPNSSLLENILLYKREEEPVPPARLMEPVQVIVASESAPQPDSVSSPTDYYYRHAGQRYLDSMQPSPDSSSAPPVPRPSAPPPPPIQAAACPAPSSSSAVYPCFSSYQYQYSPYPSDGYGRANSVGSASSQRLHTNERPFTCLTCNKKYISASGLRTHWKSTTCKPTAEQERQLRVSRESAAAGGGSPRPGFSPRPDLELIELSSEALSLAEAEAWAGRQSPSSSAPAPRPSVIDTSQLHVIECS